MKRILFATSEAVPFIKTGGLADVAGSLPKCFDKRYFDIRVILPKYACMKQEWKDKMEYVIRVLNELKLFGKACIAHCTVVRVYGNLQSCVQKFPDGIF